ncbi:hypothetical protein [Corynebacterium aquatimens]|uniref:Uncharacterized protein n=1 Tax=Corynebacterium aquatimens TaxID=1190508 RepID=A0A931E1I0_9CORY|nr:hypothetical protein [Corynebacterium aquatimens]MBG6121631.1 hypothetical protein [Corynebacterium aquatimens]WJY65830.1 hypothetical protein CAQUA_05610 [Corynebacterium aquatimens]
MSSVRKVWALARRHPGVRAAQYEWNLYRDLVRWVRGTTLVPDGAHAFPHQPGRLQLVAMFTVVLLVELVVVHLMLPDGALRIVALLLSVWGIVFIWALIASERIRPSYSDDKTLVLRRGRKVFAEIPRDIIASQTQSRNHTSETVVGDNELTLGGPAGTDTLLTLLEPIDAAEDTYPWQKKRTQPVRRVRFYAGGS